MEASGRFNPKARSNWANATRVCTCEVDAAAGQAELLRYIVSEDCGPMINPNVVEGQIANVAQKGPVDEIDRARQWGSGASLFMPGR